MCFWRAQLGSGSDEVTLLDGPVGPRVAIDPYGICPGGGRRRPVISGWRPAQDSLRRRRMVAGRHSLGGTVVAVGRGRAVNRLITAGVRPGAFRGARRGTG